MSGIDLLGFEVYWPNSLARRCPVFLPAGGQPFWAVGHGRPAAPRRHRCDARKRTRPRHMSSGPRSTIPSGRAGSRALGWR